MSVVVRFTDGSEQAFRDADSAVLDGLLFRVMKYDAKRRKSEDVSIFQAEHVKIAEISKGGIVTGIVLSRGVGR